MIFLENVDNKAFLRITVLIWIHPLEMNASSRVLLEFRIATTVLTKHKLTPVTLFQNIESNVFRCFYIVILLDLARF